MAIDELVGKHHNGLTLCFFFFRTSKYTQSFDPIWKWHDGLERSFASHFATSRRSRFKRPWTSKVVQGAMKEQTIAQRTPSLLGIEKFTWAALSQLHWALLRRSKPGPGWCVISDTHCWGFPNLSVLDWEPNMMPLRKRSYGFGVLGILVVSMFLRPHVPYAQPSNWRGSTYVDLNQCYWANWETPPI